ncbi:SDR family NAD(P)-dependent oxidoreductase [Monashia sp. NPDC004114]
MGGAHPYAVAVVTGASQGIGAAVSLRLARQGYLVWAVARSSEQLERIREAGPPQLIRPFPMDLATSELGALERALAEAGHRLGALVHCAGVIVTGSLLVDGSSDLQRLMDLNAFSPLRLTAQLRGRLHAGSTVVFVNSTQGLAASGGTGAYAASKHALKAMADAMRADLTGSGIRVTTIYPGRTATPMQAQLYAERNETYRPEVLLQPEVVAHLVHTVVALPPGAEVTDISVRSDIKSY